MPQVTQPVGHSDLTPSSFLTGPTPLGLVSVGFQEFQWPPGPVLRAGAKATADIPGRNLNPNHPPTWQPWGCHTHCTDGQREAREWGLQLPSPPLPQLP